VHPHLAVMIDAVEKFFEIKVDHNTVARGNVALRLGYRPSKSRISQCPTVSSAAFRPAHRTTSYSGATSLPCNTFTGSSIYAGDVSTGWRTAFK